MIDVLGLLADSSLDGHTSIILTYNLDLTLYDGLVRRRLRSSGITNQAVFCDFGAYQDALDALSAAPRLGHGYSVTPVRVPGAFHPKLYLVLGRQRGRLIVGSGNTSIGGLVRNAELFGVFDFDLERDESPDAAFATCIGLVREVSDRAAEPVKQQIERGVTWAPWLKRKATQGKRRLLLAGPGRPPLLDQVRELLPRRRMDQITVLSSSFDRRLAAMRKLSKIGSSVTCVVQPDTAELDGRHVASLGDAVDWRPFVAPPQKEKKQRLDLRAHAKLLVFESKGSEIAVFGSANASRPALLDPESIEAVVVLPSAPAGTTVEQLGLSESLEQPSVTDELVEKQWRVERKRTAFEYALTSAVLHDFGLTLTADPLPPAANLKVVVAPRVDGPPFVTAKVRSRGATIHASLGIDLAEPHVVSLSLDSKRVSNWVAITWHDVGHIPTSRWFGARVESALLAMHDGMVLGGVLFELLDKVRDFEVVLARSGGGKPIGAEEGEDEEDVSGPADTQAFYTDARPDDPRARNAVGDRTDLDLLAALVQPLKGVSLRAPSTTDEDDTDDSVLAEEAERRAIDQKRGNATGEEKQQAVAPLSSAALEKAVRRFERRLDRAAESLDKALQHVGQLDAFPASALARQIWMVHIGAFLAGRDLEAADGSEVESVDPIRFAEYVLRVCRAFAGGRSGGLLHALRNEEWEGHDGDSLRRGLAFLWTCAVWATVTVDEYWKSAEEDEVANGPWDAAPWLVASRFIAAVREHCTEPDLGDIERRMPAMATVPRSEFWSWNKSLSELADLIVSLEQAEDTDRLTTPIDSEKPGSLVYVRGKAGGVSVLLERYADKCHVLALSNPSSLRQRFMDSWVRSIIVPSRLEKRMRWRAMGEVSVHRPARTVRR